MRTVWKYSLGFGGVSSHMMPKGAQIVSVQAQNRDIVLWALVGTMEPMEERRFAQYGTGHPIGESNVEHVGTIQLMPGLVIHVFEIRKGDS